jgi:Flp pilus assembly protein TadD
MPFEDPGRVNGSPKPDLARQRARACAETGRYGRALEHLQEHLMAHPADVEALHEAGSVLACLGRPRQAISHLRAAMERLDAADGGEISS